MRKARQPRVVQRCHFHFLIQGNHDGIAAWPALKRPGVTPPSAGRLEVKARVSRWEAIAPHAWPGTWEGRLRRTADGQATRTGFCGHLHLSQAEAERCAQDLAARLNSKTMQA